MAYFYSLYHGVSPNESFGEPNLVLEFGRKKDDVIEFGACFNELLGLPDGYFCKLGKLLDNKIDKFK